MYWPTIKWRTDVRWLDCWHYLVQVNSLPRALSRAVLCRPGGNEIGTVTVTQQAQGPRQLGNIVFLSLVILFHTARQLHQILYSIAYSTRFIQPNVIHEYPLISLASSSGQQFLLSLKEKLNSLYVCLSVCMHRWRENYSIVSLPIRNKHINWAVVDTQTPAYKSQASAGFSVAAGRAWVGRIEAVGIALVG